MKISELKSQIEEFITEILSPEEQKAKASAAAAAQEDMKDAVNDLRTATTPIQKKAAQDQINLAKKDLAQAKAMTEAEEALMEMASFYKVKDKAGFKSALAKYKEAKGDKFDKGALGKLLSTLDKEGEVDLKALSKETGKDIATYNNPQTRGALEKEGGEFTDYLEAGKGEKASKEEDKDKPKTEPKKAEKKEEPKKEKPAPKKEEPKKAKKEEDEDDSTDEKAPSEAELKKIDKEFKTDKFAKTLSPEEKEKLNKLESGIKKKLANPTKDNIDIVKQLINKPEIKKLFKDGGKDLKALVSDIIA
jgi:hypothetical protein